MSPYLNFVDQTAEALAFYQSIFGGEVRTMTFAQLGVVPADSPQAGLAAHSELRGEIVTLLASDAPEGIAPAPLQRGNDFNLCLMTDDVAQAEGWFTALSEGGEVRMPFAQQMWGDHYGQLVDRFGITWSINSHVAA